MKIKMTPCLEDIGSYESGIKRVVEAYTKYLPKYGVEVARKNDTNYDLKVAHAGMTGGDCDVAILHGLYWTADYSAPRHEYKANAQIVEAIRSAKLITVPSPWVAEVFQRDMRINPEVVPHGIEAEFWKHNFDSEGYVLWNKNRVGDVCDIDPVIKLANHYKNVQFVTTFGNNDYPINIKPTGVLEHSLMKNVIQKSGVYLSTTKETFGIGVLEAMASGVPVLGWRNGGNVDLIKHGTNGYLATPGDYDDLFKGLEYCLKYRDVLGKNGMELVKQWTWDSAIEKLAKLFLLSNNYKEDKSVSVVIPLYNYGAKVDRAIDSALNQELKPKEVIIVDDGSTDNPEQYLIKYSLNRKSFNEGETVIRYIRKENGGVATARNLGIENATSKYVCCLDSDDAIHPEFLKVCVGALERDKKLSIAYTGLQWIKPDGATGLSEWPGEFNYDDHLRGRNQIPTCCVFKREMWERLGGYRQRYAPDGAGAEDAEFWLRAGAYGFNAKKVDDRGLFIYSWGTGLVSGNKEYKEVDWRSWHPWTKDEEHPFASVATPKMIAHKVRQYDEPVISVVIPVGPGHEELVIDALDSLEAQDFRKWEAILAWDSNQRESLEKIKKAYPYVKVIFTSCSGPGYARNEGVKISRGDFVLFLDADDYLLPGALSQLITAYQGFGGIVYSDYYGKITTNEQGLKDFGDRLVGYNKKKQEALVKHKSLDYNCELAQKMPDMRGGKLFHWCLVTCLILKEWHNEIGGFDENMDSFEDVDYHWRMARAGKCYTRVEQPFVVYRFTTGYRREFASPTASEDSRQRAIRLLEYTLEKYKRIKTMPCKTCGQASVHPEPSRIIEVTKASDVSMNDTNFVEVLYLHPNRGEHGVVGARTGINYGYRSGGDVFLVHKDDVAAQPHLFTQRFAVEKSTQIIDTPAPTVLNVVNTITPVSSNQYDLQTVPGISSNLANDMRESGIESIEDLKKLTVEDLIGFKGVGEKRAKAIYDIVQKMEIK